MLYALFTQVENARLAAVPGAHAGLELWIIAHAPVGLVVAHANPRLLDVLVELEVVLGVHLNSDLDRRVDIGLVLLDAWDLRIRDDLRVGVLDHGFLDLRASHSDRFILVGGLTSTHV